MDAEKTKWCFVCLILVIYEHSCNKDIHIGGMLEKNSVKKRLMEGEEGNVFIYLIWRVIYRMHDKWMAKLINWEIDSSLCQCELVISCQSLSDAIVTFTTVPDSQIRPYSPLYQSSEPGFLTEEWERFPDWSKEQEGLLLFLKSCSDGLYKLNPLLYFLKKKFFTWNCNRTECITVFFSPSWKTNPGHVWYGCTKALGFCEANNIFTLLLFMMMQLSSLPSFTKLKGIFQQLVKMRSFISRQYWMYTVRILYWLQITRVTTIKISGVSICISLK